MEIILLGHRMGVGKNTLGELLSKHNGYVQMAFADPLKKIVCEMFDLEWFEVNDEEAKKRVLKRHDGRTIRQVLQLFGTEVGRVISKNVWAHKAATLIEEQNRKWGTEKFVFTDFRFPNESEILQARLPRAKFITARIDRPGTLPVTGETHVSEKALLTFEWDVIINNDTTADDLYYRFYKLKEEHDKKSARESKAPLENHPGN